MDRRGLHTNQKLRERHERSRDFRHRPGLADALRRGGLGATAAGLLEPNAAWTASAKINVETALNSLMRGRNARLVHYRSTTGDSSIDASHLQAFKLHEAVGAAILVHKYVPIMALPTKQI
jgi:hypothetical protein